MKEKFIKISDKAKEELSRASINGDILTLQGQVSCYAELKKLFQTIGVEWKKKEKIHVLKPGAKDEIDRILNGGKIVDEKRTLQKYYTPLDLVKKIVQMADVEGRVCLEPSCGDGRIIKEMLDQGASFVTGIDIVESIPSTDGIYLISSGKVELNLKQDFLNINLKTNQEDGFERICANPPFDNNTWLKHIDKMWELLAPDGKMVVICPDNPAKLEKFLEGKYYDVTPIEAGAFKESGTMIKTMILEVWK